jgi:NADPH:quinone reductase-like Zn-dependent oxidoreductase
MQEELHETVAFFGAGQESGWLRPVVDKVFALEEAAESHREVISHSAGSRGKIVLRMEAAELSSVPL